MKKTPLMLLPFVLSTLGCSPKCEHAYYQVRMIDSTEQKEGKIEYQCPLCGNKSTKVLPILSEANYTVENLTVSCVHGNGKRYSSEEYGVFEVTNNERLDHTCYGGVCDMCHHQIGEFDFENHTSTVCWGYPRLIKLSSHWDNRWILSGDSSGSKCRISEDDGKTWSDPINIYSSTTHTVGNTFIYELPNHDLLCMYREIGNNTNTDINLKYSRKLSASISYDGGLNWEFLETFFDNYKVAEQYGKKEADAKLAMLQESRIGAFEPYMDIINNVPTVIYADDFTPMLLGAVGSSAQANYRSQYLISQTFDLKKKTFSTTRKIIIDGTRLKAPKGSGLGERVSRDGMPGLAKTKDGTYVIVYEGTYRDADYQMLTNKPALPETHPFEILMSYSKDGETWSDPVEIYVPHNNGSKASAPFVVINDKDQLIVSFQTDEDAVPTYVGDKYSIMKVIISKPGIPVEEITNESFYAVCNNNDTPVGQSGLWNGMMLDGEDLYTVTGGYPIRHSKVPFYVES